MTRRAIVTVICGTTFNVDSSVDGCGERLVMESRVELFVWIRRDARVEGLSVRASARLIEEHGAQELSYSTVRDYVRVGRAQIDVEAGRSVEVFVPQEHAPGAEAEVDFGEVYVVLNGVKTKCHMFIFRLSHSGRAIHRIYPTQPRKPFSRATSKPSRFLAASRLNTSAMTISPVRSLRWCSGRAGNAGRTTGGALVVGRGQRRRRRGRSPQTRHDLFPGWGQFRPSSRCSC